MMYFKHFICAMCTAVLMFPFAGCSDSSTPVVVDEKKLTLVCEQTAHTGEEVSFTVLSGEEDVTAQARIRNVKTDVYLDGVFVSEETGIFSFVAELDSRISEPVTVKILASFASERNFYRKVLVQKFTATWCRYCPQMTAALNTLDQNVPDRIISMSVHANDSFAINEGSSLVQDFNVVSLPTAVFDYRTSASSTTSQLRNALDTELQDDPAVCGIAAVSKIEGEQIVVDAKIRIAESGNFRVCCAVTEDGLQYTEGFSEDGFYHQVLRSFATSRMGDALGDCEAGTEYPCTFTTDVRTAWNLQNCNVLLYVMKVTDDNLSVFTNNVVKLPVQDGSCTFRYEAE